eukprot:Em0020g993a
MDQYLDATIGDNFRVLPDVLKNLKKDRDHLKAQLKGTVETTTEGEWPSIVLDIQSILKDLQTLHDKCTVLDHSSQLLDPVLIKCAKATESTVEEILDAQRSQSYLKWLKAVQKWSGSIDICLKRGSPQDAVRAYSQLSYIAGQLQNSKCAHLERYAYGTQQYWCGRLQDKVTSDFLATLKELKWPTPFSSSSHIQDLWHKCNQRFTELFNLLLELGTPPPPAPPRAPRAPHGGHRDLCEGHSIKLQDPLVLPIKVLLEPLKKRFQFHFYGNKKTNMKEKPEWYFTQVSTWINDHSHFMEKIVQPLMQGPYQGVNARLEFIRGLLQELEVKLLHDMSTILYEDAIMAHLIDELLLFEKELRSVVQYPSPHPSCLHVLYDDLALHKWVTLEKQFALERIEKVTLSPTAWQCQYGTWQLLMTRGARVYRRVHGDHCWNHRALQLDLLMEFHQDLVTAAKKAAGAQPSENLCAYLNSAHYITLILKKWGEQEFFLRLHYHLNPHPKHSATDRGNHPSLEWLQHIISTRRMDPQFAESEGCVFATPLAAFSSLVDDILGWMGQQVISVAKDNCKRYKRDKWHHMTLDKDVVFLDPSPSASELFSWLRDQLVFIESHVSPHVIPDLYSLINKELDRLLLTEVVASNHFSEGGATQLDYDLSKVLVSLLAEFFVDIPSVHLLEMTQEACRLLKLLPGTAKLMEGMLEPLQQGTVDTDVYSAAVTALSDMGVHTLEPLQALSILMLRVEPA